MAVCLIISPIQLESVSVPYKGGSGAEAVEGCFGEIMNKMG